MSRMKLEEKGKIIPPPVLSKYPEIASKEIQQWAGIIAATHWEIWDRNHTNGSDFYVGEIELGHIHLDGSLHVPSTKKISQALIKAGLAQKFRYAENWVEFNISNDEKAAHAIWLFNLHYDLLNNIEEATLLQRIKDYKLVQ